MLRERNWLNEWGDKEESCPNDKPEHIYDGLWLYLLLCYILFFALLSISFFWTVFFFKLYIRLYFLYTSWRKDKNRNKKSSHSMRIIYFYDWQRLINCPYLSHLKEEKKMLENIVYTHHHKLKKKNGLRFVIFVHCHCVENANSPADPK